MKKVLLALALSLAAFAANALQETPIVAATRVAGSVTSADMYIRDSGSGPKDIGVIINSHVTTVTGAVTMTFKIQGKTPQGSYYDVGTTLTEVAPVVGTVNTLILRPGITAASGSAIALPLPPVFRLVSTLTSTGSSTYSIGLSRTN
jgi:hypothetical protein